MNQSSNQSNTYLSFYLGKELFGANVKHILEVLKGETVTEIPRSDTFIKGIINFRGDIVTVIDFQKKLNMPSQENMERDVIVVVELLTHDRIATIGLLADRVRKVFNMENKDLKPVPEFGEYYNPEYLTGVAKTSEGLVMILDLEKVLNEKDVQLIIKTNDIKTN
jgi:purine-binding chemotaxis protein CheW